MIHLLQMPRHAIILHVGFRRQRVVWYGLYGLSVLHYHTMDDIVGLIIWFMILLFVLLLYYLVVCTWSWGEAGDIYRLSALVEAVLLASEAGCTTDVVDFDQHYFIVLLVCLIGWLDNWYGDVILAYCRHLLCYLFILGFKGYFVVSCVMRVDRVDSAESVGIGLYVFVQFEMFAIECCFVLVWVLEVWIVAGQFRVRWAILISVHV